MFFFLLWSDSFFKVHSVMFSSFPPGPRDSPSFTDVFEYESWNKFILMGFQQLHLHCSADIINGLCVCCSILCWGNQGSSPEAYGVTGLGVRCGAALCSWSLTVSVAFLQVCVKAAISELCCVRLLCIWKIKIAVSISLQIYGVLPSKVLLCSNSEVLLSAADPSDLCIWGDLLTAAVLSEQTAFKAKRSRFGGHERLQIPHKWITFLHDPA